MLSNVLAGTLRFTRSDFERVNMFAQMRRGAYGFPKQARTKPVFHEVVLVPFSGRGSEYVGGEFVVSFGKQEWQIQQRVAVAELRRGLIPIQFSMRSHVKSASGVLNHAAKSRLLVWLDMLETEGRIR